MSHLKEVADKSKRGLAPEKIKNLSFNKQYFISSLTSSSFCLIISLNREFPINVCAQLIN